MLTYSRKDKDTSVVRVEKVRKREKARERLERESERESSKQHRMGMN